MKIFGSISRLVSIIFRKDGQDLTFRPHQSTTYSAARDIQLPAGDADHELVGTAASQTLTNKLIDGDDNTLQDISLSSLKVALGDADKLLLRDVSGAVVSAKLENKHVASDAAIAFSKMAALTASKALVTDSSGVVVASTVTSTEIGYLAGVTSGIQAQIDTKASSAALSQEISDRQSAISGEATARQNADAALDSKIDALTTSDIAEGSNLYFTNARAQSAVVTDTGYAGTETNKALSVRAVTDALADITAAIDAETDARELADSNLAADITAEETARIAADSDLQDAIDAEASARASAVSAEASAREAADNALDGRLDILEGADTVAGSVAKALKDAKAYTDAETSARQSAVSAEQSARQSADDALDARLDVIEGADTVSGSVAKALKDAKAYADQKIADLVDGAPALLDTLNELAAAIGDDENFVTTITTSISNETSARQAADTTLQGNIDALESAVNSANSAQDTEIAKKLNKPTSGDTANYYLRSNGDGSTFWSEGFVPAVYKTNWSLATGTTKVVTHNLGSTDVVVSLIDLSDNQVIGVSSIVVTDSNTVTLTASEAPSASGWRILVQKI